MKRKIALGCVLVVGCLVAFLGLVDKNVVQMKNGAYYDSDECLKDTLGEIQQSLAKKYSSTASSKYIGDATVEETYDSFGVIGKNVSQGNLNQLWEMSNPGKTITDTCGLVANTMMIMKYQEQFKIDKDENVYDRSYAIFEVQAKYAWENKIFTKEQNGGTSTEEQVTLANVYLSQKNSKYDADSTTILLWNKVKKQLDGKIEPIIVDCTGKKINHAMMATDCYIQTVKYKEKGIFGITVKKSKDYKIIRVCDGWEGTVNTNSKTWEETTNRYLLFDCVYDVVFLK